MDNFSVRSERNFHNLVVKPNHMHLLDKPNGYASAMIKSSLSHQMRFTVQVLEEELCAAGSPHVLQIKLLGDDSREPSSWKLFADGACVADGSGAFARECFCEGAEVFLDLCRDAVRAAELRQWSQREYELLSAARGIAGASADRPDSSSYWLTLRFKQQGGVALTAPPCQTEWRSQKAYPLRLQLQQQVAQLGALLGKARLGSLAHPPTVGGPPGRVGSRGSPYPSSA